LTEDERNKPLEELFDFSNKVISTDFKVGVLMGLNNEPILKKNGGVMTTTSEASEKSMIAMNKDSMIKEYEYKEHITVEEMKSYEPVGYGIVTLFILVDENLNPLVKETKKYKKNKKTGETKVSIKKGYYIFDNKKSTLNGLRQNKSNPIIACYGPTK
jgi:hypothetical protein